MNPGSYTVTNAHTCYRCCQCRGSSIIRTVRDVKMCGFPGLGISFVLCRRACTAQRQDSLPQLLGQFRLHSRSILSVVITQVTQVLKEKNLNNWLSIRYRKYFFVIMESGVESGCVDFGLIRNGRGEVQSGTRSSDRENVRQVPRYTSNVSSSGSTSRTIARGR